MIIVNTSNKNHLPAIQAGTIQQVTIEHFPNKSMINKGEMLNCEYFINGLFGVIGDAVVTDIVRYQGNLVFKNLRDVTLESWAKREGFSSFKEADAWFTHIYGKNWKSLEFYTVYFRGTWLPEAV